VKKSLIIILLFAIGCSTKYTVINSDEDSKIIHLNPNATAYVSLPEDFASGGYLYQGSGQEISSEIVFLFSGHLKKIESGENVEDLNQALERATINRFDYLIFPKIYLWEDYATEWSGVRDKLKLQVTIIEVSTGNSIDTFMIEGTGTVWTFGGYHPIDIAKKPMKQWVDSLF